MDILESTLHTSDPQFKQNEQYNRERADELSRERIYEFLFVCLPLKFQSATGSPVRPIAIAEQPVASIQTR